eukprot:774780_1
MASLSGSEKVKAWLSRFAADFTEEFWAPKRALGKFSKKHGFQMPEDVRNCFLNALTSATWWDAFRDYVAKCRAEDVDPKAVRCQEKSSLSDLFFTYIEEKTEETPDADRIKADVEAVTQEVDEAEGEEGTEADME